MQKRVVFATLVLFLALMPLSHSAEENVFSGTVVDKNVIDIEGSEFKFRVDGDSRKVLIDIDSSGIIIASGECKVKGTFNICVSNITFSHKNLTTYTYVYKALVDVYQSKSALEITISLDKKGILIDEEVNGKLALENSADVPSKSVSATLNFPPNIALIKAENCKQLGNNLAFEGDVNARQTRECTFTVKGMTPGEFSLETDASYFDGLQDASASSNELEAEVYNASLLMAFSTNKTIFDIHEKFNLTLKGENTNPEYDISVNTFTIKIPDNILLLKRPEGTSGTDRLVSWSGTLESEGNRTFILELQPMNTGKYEIEASSSYREDKFLRKDEKSFAFSVECECPFLSHEMIDDSGRKLVRSDLVNLGKGKFRNIKLGYVTDIPGIEEYSSTHDAIEPLQRIGIFDDYVELPQSWKYYLNVTAIYESSTGEVFLLKDSIPINSGNEIVAEEIQTEDIAAESVNEETPEDTQSQEQAEEQEITVTTLEDEKRSMIIYVIAGFFLALVAITVLLVAIRKKKQSRPLEPPEKIEENK